MPSHARSACYCFCVQPLSLSAQRDGGTMGVPAGASLQQALDRARPGDTVVLEPGTTYVGNFVLPVKPDAARYITIRTADQGEGLPRPGQRVNPAHAPRLAKAEVPDQGTGPPHREGSPPLAGAARRVPADRGGRGRYHPARRRRSGATGALAGAARPGDRSLLRARRCRVGSEARHRAQQRIDDDHELLRLRHQGGRPGYTGDSRVERSGPLHHREQLPRGCGRELSYSADRIRPLPASSPRTWCSAAIILRSRSRGERSGGR